MAENGYITVREAAELFRVDISTIYTWVRAGTIPAKKIGGAWRIRKADIDQLWQTNKK